MTSTPNPATVATVDTASAVARVDGCAARIEAARSLVELSTHIAMRAYPIAHPASSGVPST